MIKNWLPIMIMRKINTSYSIMKKIKIPKKAYTNGSKNIENKVDFAVVFLDIDRRGTLSEKASIYTAEMTTIKIALKKIHKREDY